jgi:hypothetical protein
MFQKRFDLKKSVLASSICLALGVSAYQPLVMANDKLSLTTADATLAASERQAVLGISRLGLESTRFTFPVEFCALKQKCIPVGRWSVNIEHSYADQTLADNMITMIPARYDRLVFQGSEASLTTATSRIENLELPGSIPSFSAQTQSYNDFKTDLARHLNSNVAPTLADLLGDAAESRYKEMNAQDKDTFMRDKAKATGMPVEVLIGLVSSGYAFGMYLPKVEGSLQVRQVEKTLPDGRKIIVYRTSLTAPLKTRLAVYQFDGEKFSLAHEVAAEADGNAFNMAAQMISGSSSVETIFRPSENDAQKVFDEVFQTSFKDSTIALSTKLKEIREFAVATPVLASNQSGHFELRVGVQEDIRVDHPFTFKRTVDNQEKQVGWGQVRKTGDNCLMLPESKRTYSQATLVQGAVNELDLAVEHPWTGVYGRAGFSMSDTSLEIAGKDTGAGATTFFEFGFIGNLGYILNNPGLSEVWANLDLGIGATSDGDHDSEKLSADTAVRMRFGAEKRFHLMQGLYAAAGGDFAVEAHNYKVESESDPLKVSTYNLIPRAELGYFINPNMKVYGGASYNLPLATSFENSPGNSDVEMSGGLSFNLGFAMHVNFAGPFAKMMAKPSSRCDSLRD